MTLPFCNVCAVCNLDVIGAVGWEERYLNREDCTVQFQIYPTVEGLLAVVVVVTARGGVANVEGTVRSGYSYVKVGPVGYRGGVSI